jgi:hypothetical protein
MGAAQVQPSGDVLPGTPGVHPSGDAPPGLSGCEARVAEQINAEAIN